MKLSVKPLYLALSLMMGGAVAQAVAQTPMPSEHAQSHTQAQAVYPQGKWQLPKARYGVSVVEEVNITMDDGVTLSASIAYPADVATGKRASGTFPVIIEHMPYEKFAVPIGVNTFFAEHG